MFEARIGTCVVFHVFQTFLLYFCLTAGTLIILLWCFRDGARDGCKFQLVHRMG